MNYVISAISGIYIQVLCKTFFDCILGINSGDILELDIAVLKSAVGAKYCLLSESRRFLLYRFPYFPQPASDSPKFKKVFHSFQSLSS